MGTIQRSLSCRRSGQEQVTFAGRCQTGPTPWLSGLLRQNKPHCLFPVTKTLFSFPRYKVVFILAASPKKHEFIVKLPVNAPLPSTSAKGCLLGTMCGRLSRSHSSHIATRGHRGSQIPCPRTQSRHQPFQNLHHTVKFWPQPTLEAADTGSSSHTRLRARSCPAESPSICLRCSETGSESTQIVQRRHFGRSMAFI